MNKFLLMFGGIWLLVGVPFLIVGVVVLRSDRAFARNARVTRGIVLSMDLGNSGGTGGRSTKYVVRYRFTAPDGRVLEGREPVGRDRWLALAEREPIEIAYDPADPTRHRPAGTSDTVLGAIFAGLGGCFTIAGGLIFGIGVRGARRAARVRKAGMTAEAIVKHVRSTGVTINRRKQARVEYEFRDERGETRTGLSAYLPIDDATRWKPGDRITIKYDRDRPTVSIWEPQ